MDFRFQILDCRLETRKTGKTGQTGSTDFWHRAPECSFNLQLSNPETEKPVCNGERQLEKGRGGKFPPSVWKLVTAYPVAGIGALRAPFILFMSLGLPLGCSTTIIMAHSPKGDSERVAAYAPFPLESVLNIYGAVPAPVSCFLGFRLTNQTV